MGGTHARLSPSNHAWPHCPGQVREAAKYPDTTNDAAIDGTGSHLLLETCINENKTPDQYKGVILGTGHEDKPKGWLIDTDRIKRVQCAIAYIDRRKAELAEQFKGCTVKVISETESNPGRFIGRDDWYGTADITIIVENINGLIRYVEVIDYKDGRIYVDVDKNSQLDSYLSGKVFELLPHGRDYRKTVIQPRTKPIIRYKDIDADTLTIRYRKLEKAAIATDDPNAPLIPDGKQGKDWCRWCPHNPNCKELKNQIMGKNEMAPGEPGLVLPEIPSDFEKASGDMLAGFIDAEDRIKAYLKQIGIAKIEASTRIKNGEPVGCYRLKPGNGENLWKESEEKIASVLKGRGMKKDDIYIAKFITCAQVMKSGKLTDKQKEKIQSEYIEYIPGDMKLVKMTAEEIENEKSSDTMRLMEEAAKEAKQDSFSFL